MAPWREVGPGRLQIREGGGCLGLFGLPFFAAGLFLLLAAGGVVRLGNADELPWFAWPLLALMGVAFTLVGGGLAFGRSWVTIDAVQRRVSKELGLLLPMRTQGYPVDDYDAVRLRFQEGDSDTSDQFPVELQARAGGPLMLYSSTDYQAARACAGAVARVLGIDVEDSTTDHRARLSPADLDRPLRERVTRADDAAPAIDRPAGARSEVHAAPEGIRIEIPNRRLHPVALAAMLAPLALLLMFLAPLGRFFRQTNTPDLVAWIFFGFLGLGFGLLPALAALSAFRRSRVGRTIATVSRDGIRIRARGAWRTRETAVLPGADIYDVDYGTRASTMASARQAAEDRWRASHPGAPEGSVGPRTARLLAWIARYSKGRGVVIKSRQGLTSLGQDLEDDEIMYLHAVVKRGLVS